MNFMIYWQGVKYLKNILKFHGEWKYPMMMQVLHLKLHNFVQVDLLSLMWRTLQYFHLLKSIRKARYIEHGICILKNIFLFHGLRYYHNMMQVLFSF
jgi:hypothetical protein